MKLENLIENLNFVGIKNYKNIDIENLACDTSKVGEKSLFFCLNGTKNDGHNFAENAVKLGACCLVVERFLDLPITQILVQNARVAMSNISAKFYETEKLNIKFIGITGTNGKTTTTFILKDVLTALGKRVGLIGTQRVQIGSLILPSVMTTPDPIELHKLIHEMAKNNVEYIVMEVSAHAIALHKIDDIMFDAIGISNITQDHLDFFHNMENYKKCKMSVLNENHCLNAVVNIDDKNIKSMLNKMQREYMSVSIKKEADLCALDSKIDVNGIKAILNYNNETKILSTNLVGEYNLYNTLLAMGCLLKLGFDFTEILDKLRETTIYVPGRFNVLKVPKDFNVVVDYAHTPDGVQNILSTIKKMPHNRIIAVFGCGGNRDKLKRPIMGKIATSLADYSIITSDNPRDEIPEMIIKDIEKGINKSNYTKITNREEAINKALELADTDDIIVILGKGAENYQEIKGEKIPYDDYKVVDEFFSKSINKENISG